MNQQTLNPKNFLTLADFSSNQLLAILYEAEIIRAMEVLGKSEQTFILKDLYSSEHTLDLKKEIYTNCLSEKAVSLLFLHPSTRTRAAAEYAIVRNGGHPLIFSEEASQLSRGESIEDTIRCLEHYSAAFIIRTPKHELLTRAANVTKLPILNALSDEAHPIEALAQFLTLHKCKYSSFENKDSIISFSNLTQLKGAYLGDGSNVATSLAWAADKLGVRLTFASPEGYDCSEAVQEKLKTSKAVHFVTDPVGAIKGADVIFGDTFVSMGDEPERKKREQAFQDYQVNEELVQHAQSDYVYIHCLPAYRGQEVTASILDGKHSIVFDVAMSRLLIYRALLKIMTTGFTINPNRLPQSLALKPFD